MGLHDRTPADLLGDHWTLLVLRDACLGLRRFEEFHRDLGISRNILTDRLNLLVERGLLRRVPYRRHPPRHEYRLTDKGRDAYPVLRGDGRLRGALARRPRGEPHFSSTTPHATTTRPRSWCAATAANRCGSAR
ncbi:MAG: helix-turn-helix transcriptional regulator [Microthrixaceae bacterium]|nr:helix-turn-helix transcriptional regulator [Microthrixaceae bacterium]